MRMFDSVTIPNIPSDAKAVAGYVGGYWPTYWQLRLKFAKAHVLSIAINASEHAECLDIEKGDATISQATAWVKREIKRGVYRPVVYCSISDARSLMRALEVVGIKRKWVRLWTAHYTEVEHRCGPECGFGMNTVADGTQWTPRAQGKNLDESLVADNFFAKPVVKKLVYRVHPWLWLRFGRI